MKKQHSKILFIILTTAFLSSCNSIKRVSENEHLLTKNTILVNEKVESSDAINNLLYQKPNRRLPLFNIPLKLYFYNLARPNIDSIIAAKIKNNPKKKARQERFLSKKQYNKFIETKKDFNKWIKKTGEAPVIINDTLSKKSIKRLEKYYFLNGWFEAKADYKTTKGETNRKATTQYTVTTGEPYLIDSLSTKISSPIVDSLYRLTKGKSLIELNDQYKANNLLAERDRITNMMRNSGVYHFSEEAIYLEIDSIGKTKKVNIDLQIKDRSIVEGDTTISKPFKIYKVKDVNIFTDNYFSNNNSKLSDSVKYKGFNIYSYDKLAYKPKALTNAIFITPNSVFKDINRPLTSRKISDLRTFKYPSIDYVENPDSTLTANIYLTPLKKFNFGFSADVSQSNIQSVGFSLSPTLSIRNVFKGAETLEISGIASVGASKDGLDSRDAFFDIKELGGNIKLTIPRLFFPLNTEKIIPKKMFPSTIMNLAATSQTNIGLDKETLTGNFLYQWLPNNSVTNKFELFNIQYIRNKNINRYYDIYTNSYNSLNEIASLYNLNPNNVDSDGNLTTTIGPSGFTGADVFAFEVLTGQTDLTANDFAFKTVSSLSERKVRLTENNLIVASSYAYEVDTQDNYFDLDFSTFKFKVELAGNTLSSLANLVKRDKNDDDRYEFFNVAYSQYIKTEFNYTKHWHLGNNNVLAMRSFFGIALPYGNSNTIPFSKSFFAGGPNDNRAWQAYGLGPGDSKSIDDYNEGNLKFAVNLEQRFPILGNVKGALFIDAGNIWNFENQSEELDDYFNQNTTFRGFQSLENIAIGSGFGLRYDFGFVVLRLDTGFKTYDPSYQEENRWFNDYNFANAVYNISINYPF